MGRNTGIGLSGSEALGGGIAGSGFLLFTQSDNSAGIYADAAARDVYFGANPSDLARLDANEFLIIKLLDDGGGDVAYQQRQSAAWVDVTSLVQGENGPAGATGNSYFFASLAARDTFFSTPPNEGLLETDLPVVVSLGNDTTTTYAWTGATAPVSYDPENWRVTAQEVSSGTLFLGQGGASISSGNEVLNFISPDGVKHYLHGVHYDDTGSFPPTFWTMDPISTFPLATVSGTTLSDPQQVSLTNTTNAYVKEYQLIPATTGNLRVQTWFGPDDTGAVLVDSTFTITAPMIGVLTTFTAPNDTLVVIGQTTTTRFSGVQLEGGVQVSGPFIGLTTPFIDLDIWNSTEANYATDNIYTANGTLTAPRIVVGNNADSMRFFVYDFTDSDFLEFGELSIRDGEIDLGYTAGDGVGGVTGTKSLQINSIGMIVEDDIDNKGLEYGADYSANFTARSLVDMAYSDTNSLYKSDGTISGNRTVTCENGEFLLIDAFNTTAANYTARGELFVDDANMVMSHVVGDGAGGSLSTRALTVGASGITVLDSTASKGMVYAADYSANYTDRSLPDFASVQPRSSDVVYVRSLSDFPTPVASVITLAPATKYFMLESVDIGGNQIKYSVGSSIQGQDKEITVLSGTTSFPLLMADAAEMKVNNVALTQNGSGELVHLDSAGDGHQFTWVNFNGGDLMFIAGTVADFDQINIGAGVRFVQSSSGGVDNILLENFSLTDAGGSNSLFVFETGSTTDRFRVGDGVFVMVGSGTVVEVEEGATITNFEHAGANYVLATPSTTGIQVANPDDILLGTFSNNTIAGAGTVLRSQPISSSSFASPGTGTASVPLGLDGSSNLLIGDTATDTIYQMVGLTVAVNASIATPGTSLAGITWASGNLISNDTGTGLIYVHAGFSITISDSFAVPGTVSGTRDMVFDGTNLFVLNSTDNAIYVLEGLSATILKTIDISAVTTNERGISYDGENIILIDNLTDEIIVLVGTTNVENYRFDAPATTSNVYGITVANGGFALIDLTLNSVFLYDYPVTFTQNSRTWDIKDSPPLIDSSPRGGSQFNDTAGVTLTLAQNVWADVSDLGVSLFFNPYTQMEKCRLLDEDNGTVIWTGARSSGRSISMSAVITRTSGGAGDVFFEIAFAISKDAGVTWENVLDGSGRGPLQGNNSWRFFTTLPINKIIETGDYIKPIIRNTTNTVDPMITNCSLSIT